VQIGQRTTLGSHGLDGHAHDAAPPRH
jgi:hypothetical protein